MAETPRDFNKWMKSVERRLQQALRSGQSAQAVQLAREVQVIRDEIGAIEAGTGPAPAAPVELVVQTRLFVNSEGRHSGEISVDFPDVTRAVNGDPITVDRYELWVRDVSNWDESNEEDRRVWVLQATASESSLSYAPLIPKNIYQVRVRAVARGVPSPYSAIVERTIEADTTPPPIPAALELTSSGATVTASWNLLAETGERMPSDFAFTEVAYSYHPAPSEVVATLTNLFSQYIFETPPVPDDADYDGTWYFRHRAVDTSGNRSEWSPQSSIVPKRLVDEASIRFEMDEKQREIDAMNVLLNSGLSEVNQNLIPLQQLSDQNKSRLDELNTVTLPELNTALTTGLAGANEWRNVGAIEAAAVRIGDWDNLFSDPAFDTLPPEGTFANPWWSIATQGRWITRDVNGRRTLSLALYSDGISATASAEFGTRGAGPWESGIPANGGESFYFQVGMHPTGTQGHRQRVALIFRDPGTRAIIKSDLLYPAQRTSFAYDDIQIEAPPGRSLLFVAFQVLTGYDGTFANFSEPYLRRMSTGRMIVNGTIFTDNLAARVVTLDKMAANSVGADQVIANSIGTDHLQANTIQAQHLAIGSFDNVILDPTFDTVDRDGNDPDPGSPWQRITGTRGAWRGNGHPSGHRRQTLVSHHNWHEGNSRIEYRGSNPNGVPVSGGDQFTLEVEATNCVVRVRFREDGGKIVATTTLRDVRNTGWTKIAESFTVPENVLIARMSIDIESYSADANIARLYAPTLRRRVEGSLIVDGTIMANHLATNSVTTNALAANSVTTTQLAANAVQAGNILANAVTADKIDFGSLNGSLITGLQIQTHTDNRGVKITNAGIRAFNSGGSETFNVDATTGSVTAAGGTFTGGTFQTSSNWASAGGAVVRQDGRLGNFAATNTSGQVTARLGGSRNELSNLAVVGPLRMGSSSAEGGLVPDQDRLRVQGRLPFDTGAGLDMFQYGLSPVFGPAPTGDFTWDVVYPEARPFSNSAPIVTCATVGSFPSVTAASTDRETVSGFQARATGIWLSGGGINNHRFRIRYVTFWRG